MLTILIVDDEPLILNGLMSMIRHRPGGSAVVIGASDAAEALEAAERSRPDLVITDIHMPEMNGLELIEAMQEMSLCERFVILTGYEDFGYARQALRYGALDYLLKPIDKQVLYELLDKVGEQKERELKRIAERQQAALGDMLFFNAAPEDLELEDEAMAQAVPTGETGLLLLQYPPHQEEAAYETLCRLQTRLAPVAERIRLLRKRLPGQALMLIESKRLPAVWETVAAEPWRFAEPGEARPSRLLVGASEAADLTGRSNLHGLYIRARAALDIHKLYGRPALPPIPPPAASARMLTLLCGEGGTEQESELREIAEQLAQAGHPQSAGGADDIAFMLGLMELYLQHRGLSQDHDGSRLTEREEAESGAVDPDQVAQRLVQLVRLALPRPERQAAKHSYSPTMNRILRYVEEHFQEDVSLDQLSEALKLHANYISALFKQETGETFLHYLHAYRIERAKAWIVRLPDMPLHQIALKAGYENTRHFFKMFKKITELTPGQFRAQADQGGPPAGDRSAPCPQTEREEPMSR